MNILSRPRTESRTSLGFRVKQEGTKVKKANCFVIYGEYSFTHSWGTRTLEASKRLRGGFGVCGVVA